METTKTFKLLSSSLLLILLLISIASAQTLVAGKIYDSNYNSLVSDASVAVTCNSNTRTTTSLDDGTYAVRFDVELCNIDDSVSVIGTKGDLSGSDSGVVIECNDPANCAESYVSIINLAIKAAQTPVPENNDDGSSGGSRRSVGYYYCGNNKCDTGESIATCPKDCKVNATANTTLQNNTSTSQGTIGLTIEENHGQNATDNETQNQRGLITGAVIGAEGNSGLLVIIIFLSILLASLIVVRFMRNRKTITESI